MVKGATFTREMRMLIGSIEWALGPNVHIVEATMRSLRAELEDILSEVWDDGFRTAQDEVGEWHRPDSGLE